MAKPTTRTPVSKLSHLDAIETLGEDLDGHHLEIIADPASNRGLRLLRWSEKSVEISPQIKHRGQTYCPATLSPSLLRNTRLPSRIGRQSESAGLNSKIANEFRKRIGLPVDDADRITGVCISTWFGDILPTLPSTWVCGEDALPGIQLLRLAACFCRRPLLLGSIDRAGWKVIADFHPTLVIFDDGESRGI
jgi:hypothetical protein